MELDILRKVKRVDAPPFLLTRIKSKIEQSKYEIMPKRMAIAIVCSFALLLIVNSLVLIRYKSKPAETLAQTMHLSTNNDLY